MVSSLTLLALGWAFGYLFFGVPRLSLKDDDAWNELVMDIAAGDAAEWDINFHHDKVGKHKLSGIKLERDFMVMLPGLLHGWVFTGPNGKPLPLCRAAKLTLLRSMYRAKREQAKRAREAEMFAVAEKVRRLP